MKKVKVVALSLVAASFISLVGCNQEDASPVVKEKIAYEHSKINLKDTLSGGPNKVYMLLAENGLVESSPHSNADISFEIKKKQNDENYSVIFTLADQVSKQAVLDVLKNSFSIKFADDNIGDGRYTLAPQMSDYDVYLFMDTASKSVNRFEISVSKKQKVEFPKINMDDNLLHGAKHIEKFLVENGLKETSLNSNDDVTFEVKDHGSDDEFSVNFTLSKALSEEDIIKSVKNSFAIEPARELFLPGSYTISTSSDYKVKLYLERNPEQVNKFRIAVSKKEK
ncbi:hypothetical protein bcgnr5390_11320 [Bacillus luti]|nr:hypothetical protein BC2903_29590 [Bacillus cereus]